MTRRQELRYAAKLERFASWPDLEGNEIDHLTGCRCHVCRMYLDYSVCARCACRVTARIIRRGPAIYAVPTCPDPCFEGVHRYIDQLRRIWLDPCFPDPEVLSGEEADRYIAEVLSGRVGSDAGRS